DDLEGHSFVYTERQSFAQRLFVGEDAARQRFADQNHFSVLPDFLLGEAATAQQRNPHRAQIILIDATKIRVEFLPRPDWRSAFYGEGRIVGLAAQRQLGNHSYGLDAGQRGQAFLQLSPKRPGLLRRVICAVRQIDPRRQHIRGVKARIDLLQLDVTADEQARADEQNDGDGGFKDHKQAAGAIARCALARALADVLERFAESWPRGLQRGRQSKQQAGQQRDAGGEAERGAI